MIKMNWFKKLFFPPDPPKKPDIMDYATYAGERHEYPGEPSSGSMYKVNEEAYRKAYDEWEKKMEE
jgi:hypothetical protein